MKYIRALGYVIAAEILSLFIGLTLAMYSSFAIRCISAVCTIGILICLVANFAINTASDNLKNERISGKKASHIQPLMLGITVSLPALASWILLYISHLTAAFDFYKWHKLLNAYFLQIYNFINSDASSTALTSGQIYIMLIFVFIPFLTFISTYYLKKHCN